MHRALLFFMSFVLIHSHAGLAAAKEPVTLEEVVVTATRIESPLERTTTSVTVITEKEIREQQAETVLELLRNVPGLDVVQSGSRGTITSVFIRGANSDQSLVMIDGVEVNSTTAGSFNFAHLTTENVERIEILRGAGGTLYGSQAVGGVINIITKKGEGPLKASLSLEGGNGRTHRQGITLRGRNGPLAYSLAAGRLETEGFRRTNDDYQNLTTSGRLDYDLTSHASIRGIFRFVKTDLGLFNNNNFVAGAVDPNARSAVSQYVSKLEWEQRLFPAWDYRISGSFFREHSKFSDDPDAVDTRRVRDRIRPQIGTGEFQTNYRFGEWSTTTFGVEFKRRKASTSSGINRAIRNLGYYLQEQISLLDDRLILIPGVRLDNHQTFGSEWSPAFSAAYLLRETGTKLKAGYAEGFKAPTLNDLFFPRGFPPGCPPFGNPDLGPERSWEINAGFEQETFGDRLRIEGTYFHREVEDLIGSGVVGGCFRAVNLGKARFDGVEWGIRARVFDGLSMGANYTYLDWDTRDGRLLRRPRHRGSINLNYRYENFNVNFDANIVGSRDDRKSVRPFPNTTKPGYAKFDLALSYSVPVGTAFLQGVRVFAKIENLFNKKYEEADGFRARPLNFLAGARWEFGGR